MSGSFASCHSTKDLQLQRSIDRRAVELRQAHEHSLWAQTDRHFAMLLALQWLGGLAMAFWLSPWAWEGVNRHIHPHVWTAATLGGLIAVAPITLALYRPGQTITRMVIAVAQMLHSALLIHLS